jgi:hypothetical protein
MPLRFQAQRLFLHSARSIRLSLSIASSLPIAAAFL